MAAFPSFHAEAWVAHSTFVKIQSKVYFVAGALVLTGLALGNWVD